MPDNQSKKSLIHDINSIAAEIHSLREQITCNAFVYTYNELKLQAEVLNLFRDIRVAKKDGEHLLAWLMWVNIWAKRKLLHKNRIDGNKLNKEIKDRIAYLEQTLWEYKVEAGIDELTK